MNQLSAKEIVTEALKKALPKLPTSEISNTKNELYADLGIDSRRFIRIIQELEILLKREINDEDVLEKDLITIDDLISFIDQLRNNGLAS